MPWPVFQARAVSGCALPEEIAGGVLTARMQAAPQIRVKSSGLEVFKHVRLQGHAEVGVPEREGEGPAISPTIVALLWAAFTNSGHDTQSDAQVSS